MVKRILLILCLLAFSSLLAHGYGVWQPDGPHEVETEELERIVEELESAIKQAEEGQSAHPAFLQHLREILAQFKALLNQLTSGDEWATYSYDAPRDIDGRTSHIVEGITMYMRLAKAATFPTGVEDDGEATILNDFWIAETPVTYELWYNVRIWGEENGYTFGNRGREGSHGDTGQEPTAWGNEPVTRVNWYDVIVWCNALSELLGYDPVYLYHGTIYRDSTDSSSGNIVVRELRNGFRLPTDVEYELAARYRGSDPSYGAIENPEGSGSFWSPGNFASGAVADTENVSATQDAAWYEINTDKTQSVGLKPPSGNGLGLFDMSGNVREWTFDRRAFGGDWNSAATSLQVGRRVGRIGHGNTSNALGFRLARD